MAAIAIPRLGLFTTKADLAADNATASAIARAAQLLVAEKNGNPVAADWTAFDPTTYVEGMESGTTYAVYMDANKNVAVTYGTGKYPANYTVVAGNKVK